MSLSDRCDRYLDMEIDEFRKFTASVQRTGFVTLTPLLCKRRELRLLPLGGMCQD